MHMSVTQSIWISIIKETMFILEICFYVQFSTNKIYKACYYRNTYTCALKNKYKRHDIVIF